jgi:hypothetical protein
MLTDPKIDAEFAQSIMDKMETFVDTLPGIPSNKIASFAVGFVNEMIDSEPVLLRAILGAAVTTIITAFIKAPSENTDIGTWVRNYWNTEVRPGYLQDIKEMLETHEPTKETLSEAAETETAGKDIGRETIH